MAALRIDEQRIDCLPITRNFESGQVGNVRRAFGGLGEALQFAHIQFVELEVRTATRFDQVGKGPMGEVIDSDNAVASRQEGIRQVRPEKTRNTGNNDCLFFHAIL